MTTPTDKPPRISFNAWIKLAPQLAAYGDFAANWQSRRGRLTRESVAKRAPGIGAKEEVALSAWDQYVRDTASA